MSQGYQAVGWNRQKKLYDLLLLAGIGTYLAIFLGGSIWLDPEITAETAWLRASGSLALVLLHGVLSIGPLARLDPRCLPLLYNRRHLGVAMFLVAASHGLVALVQFHALGVLAPLTHLLGGSPYWGGPFPFQTLGFFALVILFGMAATSHDFWLELLGPRTWKTLHMLVYVAYALVLLHVVLGALQVEDHPMLVALVVVGFVWLATLHLLAARREKRVDGAEPAQARADGAEWLDLCEVGEIPPQRARIFPVAGERVAVFRHGQQLSAISNVCRHQNGPLGEGKIVDGCVVCPWHGYQYRPADGASPPPFTEKVATYRLALRQGRVWLDPRALPPGTYVEPLTVDPRPAEASAETDDGFFIGYLPQAPATLARFLRWPLVALFLVVCGIAAGLPALHRPSEVAFFEYGVERLFEGVLTRDPQPILWVAPPTGPPRPLMLVGFGKRGATAELEGLKGRIQVRGSLIYRDELAMLEIAPGSARALDTTVAEQPPVALDLGRQTLRGEIVDGKCHLGVMKPGSGRLHRECARLCLLGGVPALFVVRGADGRPWLQALVVGPQGGGFDPALLDRVAIPVAASGQLESWGDLLVFRVNPAEVRPL